MMTLMSFQPLLRVSNWLKTKLMVYHFIINPVAGEKISEQVIEIIEEYAKLQESFEYTINLTQYEKHGIELSKAVTTPGDIVVSVGGDGSTFDVLNGLQEGVGLAIIPAGTGNDFVRMVGIPKNYSLKDTIINTLEGKKVTVDCGQANGHKYINSLNVGLDVAVLLEYNEMRERRAWSAQLIYIVAAIKTLMRYETYQIDFEIDGSKGPSEIILLTMMNGKYYGGGFKPTPEAELQDGRLDICYVEKLPFLKVLQLFVKYRSGKHVGAKGVHVKPFDRVVIKSEKPLHFGCDGEVHQDTRIEVAVLKDAVELLVPNISPLN